MAIEIVWSEEAQQTFEGNLVYLRKEWSEKEVRLFIEQIIRVIKRIGSFPESYPPGRKSKQYRRAKLNKNIALFYQYQKTKRKMKEKRDKERKKILQT